MEARHRFSATASTTEGRIEISPRPSVAAADVISRARVNQRRPRVRRVANVEAAVYGHIKAVRSLGRNTINTRDIASALSLPLSDVDAAVRNLQVKGVKRVGK